MEKKYWLSEADVTFLRQLKERMERVRQGPRIRTVQQESSYAPEVYLAYTPSSGIPALGDHTGTADLPSCAECQIYRMDDLLDTTPGVDMVEGLTKVVYNMSSTAIPGDNWILAIRDKLGTWFSISVDSVSSLRVLGYPSGTGVSSAEIIDVPDSALQVTSSTRAKILEAAHNRAGFVAASGTQKLGTGERQVDSFTVNPNYGTYVWEGIHLKRSTSSQGIPLTGAYGADTTSATWLMFSNGSTVSVGSPITNDTGTGNDYPENHVEFSWSASSPVESLGGGVIGYSSINFSGLVGVGNCLYLGTDNRVFAYRGFSIGPPGIMQYDGVGEFTTLEIGPGTMVRGGIVINEGTGSFGTLSTQDSDDVDLDGKLVLSGVISPSQITSNVDNYNPTGW